MTKWLSEIQFHHLPSFLSSNILSFQGSDVHSKDTKKTTYMYVCSYLSRWMCVDRDKIIYIFKNISDMTLKAFKGG